MTRRSKKNTVSKATRKADRKANRKATRKTATAKDAPTTASKNAYKAACHFLRIPIEIRLKIYGYLFLDPPRAVLHPTDTYVARDGRLQDEDEIAHKSSSSSDSSTCLDPEDDTRDFGGSNPYGIPWGDMCDGMFNEVYYGYNGYGPLGFMGDISDPPSSDSIDDSCRSDNKGSGGTGLSRRFRVQRHLAILRTSRKIYNEASALLHTDLAIDVNPGDALRLIPSDELVKQTGDVLRRDPSKGIGFTNTSEPRVYKSRLLDGIVESHVFARFEKVSYHPEFSFDFGGAAPSLYINDDLSVRAEDGAKFVSFLTTAKVTTRWFEDPISGRRFDNGRRETLKDVAGITISSATDTQPSTADMIQDFVHLLSNSPLVRHLEVILKLGARHKNTLAWDSDYEPDSDEEAKDDEKAEVANERATELFLECSVLDSLRKLSNVKSFSVKIGTKGRGGKVMKPRQRHLNIIRDLKDTIEKNWVVKHGTR